MPGAAAGAPGTPPSLPPTPASATAPEPPFAPGAPIEVPGEASEDTVPDGAPSEAGPPDEPSLDAPLGRRASAGLVPESWPPASAGASAMQAAGLPLELIGSQLVAPRAPASCWT